MVKKKEKTIGQELSKVKEFVNESNEDITIELSDDKTKLILKPMKNKSKNKIFKVIWNGAVIIGWILILTHIVLRIV